MADTTGGDRARVVEEAVRMASSLAERATRDVRELTHELVDAGRASGDGSVSFLMTRLMELAGSVTGFVQELQHYELRRRDTLPVVGLVAGGRPVTVMVPAGVTEVHFAFLLENDLARALDRVTLLGAADDPEGGPFRLRPVTGASADGVGGAPAGAAEGSAAGSGVGGKGAAGSGATGSATGPGGAAGGGAAPPVGDGLASVDLTCEAGSWLWGERRRVEGVATVPAGFADTVAARIGPVGCVLDQDRRPASSIEVIVQAVRPVRPGAAPG